MIKGQKLSRTTRRRQSATDFWLKVASEYNQNITPEEIATHFLNPKTGKRYTPKHIYWILRQLNIPLTH